MALCSAGYGDSDKLEQKARKRDGGRLTERFGKEKDVKKRMKKNVITFIWMTTAFRSAGDMALSFSTLFC
jgi:hypothetical protein